MKRSYLGLLILAVFVPVGLRVISWPGVVETKLEAAEVAEGKMLFTHVWQPNDPLAGGDGVGPVFNANSCVACHFQGGVGGSGGLTENVTLYSLFDNAGGCGIPFNNKPTVNGTLHAKATAPELLETMDLLDRALPKTSQPTLEMISAKNRNGRNSGSVAFSQRNTPALFGAKLIEEIPDREIIAIARRQQLAAEMAPAATGGQQPVGRIIFTKEGRVGKFGWKAQTVSLLEFVQGACANELGLSTPTEAQPTPITKLDYKAPATDLTLQQCKQMTAFIAALPAPRQELPDDPAELKHVHRGQAVFANMGCAVCHVPNVSAAQGIYSDLLLHRMGKEFETQDTSYSSRPVDPDPESSPLPDEWRTPPLWGVADSAPYMHDGRAKTLTDAIRLHGGQAASSARQFDNASPDERQQLLTFLKSLRAPAAAAN